MSFANEIESQADGADILGIVIGGYGNAYDINESDEDQYVWSRNKQYQIPVEMKGKVLTWAEIREYLDYTYDSGFGTEECHSITAWTDNKVIFVGCYDGSTWVTSVPRNPQDHIPHMVGGG